MSQPARNINTDGPMSPGDGQKLFDAVPSVLNHLQHHERQDKKKDGVRTQLRQDDQEQREIIDDSKVRQGCRADEYEKSRTQPFTTDAKGRRVPVDWEAPFRTEQARAKAAIEANAHERNKIGPNVSDELRKFCATNKTWREVEMPRVVDDRPVKIGIAERLAKLKEVEHEEIEDQNANRTDAEGEMVIRADYGRRKLAGAPKFGDVLQGGSFRHNGQFTPANPGARPQFATAPAIVHATSDLSVFVEVDDALNFLIWADDDEKILAKLLKAARAANVGKRQISEADKTKMLREIAVRKLAAQRHLESAYRHAEAQGVEVKRRPQPPEVLLWLEADTTAPTPPKKTVTVAPVEKADDEMDFEGDE